MQRHPGRVDQSLEELLEQIDIEGPDLGAGERDAIDQSRSPRQIDHHARECLVQRHIGMTIAADALLVAERTRERLTERDAQILDRVMIIDVPVADRLDV